MPRLRDSRRRWLTQHIGDLLGLEVDAFEPSEGQWDLLQRVLAAIFRLDWRSTLRDARAGCRWTIWVRRLIKSGNTERLNSAA